MDIHVCCFLQRGEAVIEIRAQGAGESRSVRCTRLLKLSEKIISSNQIITSGLGVLGVISYGLPYASIAGMKTSGSGIFRLITGVKGEVRRICGVLTKNHGSVTFSYP